MLVGDYQKRGQTGTYVKPLNSWIVKRLKVLAEVIGVQVPSADALGRLAGTLSGFSEAVIDSACRGLEDAPQGDFRRLPTPHELTQACQRAAYKPRKPEFDHDAYLRDVHRNPQNYVAVADCIREVIDMRRRAGKPVWNFADPRRGDAA